MMALQSTDVGLVFWRFLAGIGIGVEFVTIDTYLSELVPVERRGKAFAFTSLIGTTAYPITAFLAWALVPATPFGVDGWRWVAIIGAAGAIVAWFLRLGLPESPRWLAQHGRFEEAERITRMIEGRVETSIGRPLPAAAVPRRRGRDRQGRVPRDVPPALPPAHDHADHLSSCCRRSAITGSPAGFRPCCWRKGSTSPSRSPTRSSSPPPIRSAPLPRPGSPTSCERKWQLACARSASRCSASSSRSRPRRRGS
jgi:hypothetical protein